MDTGRAESAMNADGYAQFLSAQGMRTVRTDGHLWVEKQRFCLENVPPHARIHLDAEEAWKLFLRGYLVLRYSCEESEGAHSAEYVCEDPEYDLESLDAKARNKVRQGLKNCVVGPVEFDLLRRKGCVINRSVFQRQGRRGPPFLRDQKCWEQYIERCKKTTGVEAYGAFAGNDLCAYTLIVRVDDYAYTYHPFAEASRLQFRPMNALIFRVTQHLLQTPGVRRVSYGLESLVSQPALDDFKSGMGFRAVPIGRRILLNPLARPLVSRHAAGLIRRINQRLKGILYLENYLSFVEGYRRYVV
jgi:hypothetical protein